jgi:hypothetical protein
VGPTAGKFRPTSFRSPDRPARSESLYGLSYPGPVNLVENVNRGLIKYTSLCKWYLHFVVCILYRAFS